MSREKKIAPWEDIVLRLIAVYKFLHGMVFIGIGFGLIKLKHHDVPQFLMTYVIEPLHFSPENKVIDWLLDEAAKLTDHRLVLLSDAAFFYALLFCIEGVGLFLRKHWAEYFVVIVTGSLLPFEIWTLILKVEWWKCGAILGNLLILTYLIHRLRLDFTNSPGRRGDDDSHENTGLPPHRGKSEKSDSNHVAPGRR
jgi:uncharacterized membrane protein (DUF2068 family)